MRGVLSETEVAFACMPIARNMIRHFDWVRDGEAKVRQRFPFAAPLMTVRWSWAPQTQGARIKGGILEAFHSAERALGVMGPVELRVSD